MSDRYHYNLRESLSAVFGSEWFALSRDDKALIMRDCTEDGGVDDLCEYRRHIGTGNLARYALTQRVRFAKKYPRHNCDMPHTDAAVLSRL